MCDVGHAAARRVLLSSQSGGSLVNHDKGTENMRTRILVALTIGLVSMTSAKAEVIVRDHRTPPVVVVRDHRTQPVVRDHRTGPIVRDHRTATVVVRDHR